MRKIRLLTLAAFALLVVGAASASSASAAFKLEAKACDGGKPAVCWEKAGENKLQELVGEEEFTVEQETTKEALFEALTAAETTLVHIVCAEGSGSGTVTQTEPLVKPTTASGIITFKKCKLMVPTTCTIEETQKTETIAGTLPTTKDLVLAPAGKVFIEINFKGEKCPATLKGKQPVTGVAECLWLTPEIDAAGQLCESIHTDGSLKFGANPASLEGLFAFHFPTLEKEDLWDLVEA